MPRSRVSVGALAELDAPRRISPELVLVDPELAAVARRSLPLATAITPAGLPAHQDETMDVDSSKASAPLRIALAGSVLLNLALLGAACAVALTDAPTSTPTHVEAPVVAVSTAVAPAPVARSPASGRHGKTPVPPKLVRSVGRPASTHAGPVRVVLRWKPVVAAKYYDFVLWRDGRRILDLYPRTPDVRVPLTWSRDGRRLTLAPGTYKWWAFAQIGTADELEFRGPAGSGTFEVEAVDAAKIRASSRRAATSRTRPRGSP